MQLTFRAKLLLILITAALSLVSVIAGSALLGLQQARDLADVEGRMIPRLEFGPRIETEFDRLRQGMQDAVAAQDSAALEAADQIRLHLFDLIARAGPALDAAAAAQLRWTIQDYYKDAESVSRRLIAGETGELLVDDIARMQERQRRARELITKTTRLDRQELSAGFAAVRNATLRANRFRLVMGLCGLGLSIGLSVWAARGMLRILSDISSGFARFATGDFTGKIPVSSNDELGRIAKEANQMAASLSRLAEQRDRADWLKAGEFELLSQIRGELEPALLAERALTVLSRRIGARVGAVYLSEDDGALVLSAHHALSGESSELAVGEPARKFPKGAGLLGQAALADDLLVVDDVPDGYLTVRSGLGKAEPRCLVFLPLRHLQKTLGVLEFALFGPLSEQARELLASIREPLVVALEAAKSRVVLRELLEEAQQLAERLATQEEELRVNNHELRAQQEELRTANEELEAQRGALRAQNEELEDARRRLQQKAEELSKVSSYKSQFLANMSHELRTPLNSMLLLSQLLSENEGRNLTPKQVLHCKTIHSAGEDLLALINQVLDLAKIESGRQDVELEIVALNDFVAYVRRLFEPVAQDKGVQLVTEIAPDMPQSITTDRQRVERILTNLLGNALKFTDRGEVSLRIERPGSRAEVPRSLANPTSAIAFVVGDTGIGIPAEAHERIFAPFEQVESRSDRRYAGTGLGLAITRESAQLLGGELMLESSSPKGSIFVCYLPENSGRNAAKAASDSGPPRVAVVPDDRARLQSTAAHLLVIEDDRVLSEQLVDIAHACAFQVLAASSGEEGLKLAREYQPKGILLDVKLPDIDGWTVMDRLRNDPRTRDIPVHFLSGVDAADRGLALGAVGYLTKPATHAELTAAVRAVAPLAVEHRRILVVEDSEDAAEAIVLLLAREKLVATIARDAAHALSLISQEEFACIVLDLGLPDMDGTALLEALRERAPARPPPIIVHTGRALTKQETRLLETYADSVVLKDGHSSERLIEEVRLFVRHLEGRLPRPRKSDVSEVLRAADVSLAKVKVLIAEDDIRTVYALSALLAGKGADVLVAENGREALELLSRNTDVRAVLMDIMMPEMDGYEAMRRLRRDPRFEALPVIALTAKAMKGERERCLEAGASDYLTKPVDSERLLATLKDWLETETKHASGRY
ncbi:MAG TPA: response regulator [Polyangiaceae bacterium]|nr:response regulator [Polyangiaceae bacterium]